MEETGQQKFIVNGSAVLYYILYFCFNGGIMVSVLASSMVDRGFDSRSGQLRLCSWYLLLIR
jgi:hypothetical protein